MNYQIVKEVKFKSPNQEVVLFPGQVIHLDSSRAKKLIEDGKIEPVKDDPSPMSEARRQSLQEVMDATTLTMRDRIIEACKGRQYKATDEIRMAEQEIERLQHDVMNGQASISDYQAACEKWLLLTIESLKVTT